MNHQHRVARSFALMVGLTIALGCSAQETCGLQTAVFGSEIFKDGFENAPQALTATHVAAKGGGLGPPLSTVPPPALGVTPTISVTYPAVGAAIPTGRVQVVGTVTGPTNTGVTVNGVLAYVHNGTFATPEFALPVEVTSLEAKATTLDGLTATASRTVSSGTTQPDVSISNDLPAGFAPLNASFLLSVQPSIAVQSVAVDFGDGGTFTGTDPDAIPRHTYASPGIYVAQLTITDTSAQQYTSTRRVIVLGLPQQRETICAVYAHLRARLAANDGAGALLAFHPKHRPRYEELFNALGANRPVAATRLGVIANGLFGVSDAELTLVNDDPGGINGYPMHMSLGPDGVWRIDAM